MTLFILEVPHLGDPRVWAAASRQEWRIRCYAGFNDYRREDVYDATHDMSKEDEDGEPPLLELTEGELNEIFQSLAGYDCSFYAVCDSTEEALNLVKRLRQPDAPHTGKCGPLVAAMYLERLVESELQINSVSA